MQKPKHNKRQHQMCWAEHVSNVHFSSSRFPRSHIIKRNKNLWDTFYVAIHFFPRPLFRLQQGKNTGIMSYTNECEARTKKKSFHEKLNENKKYDFSISFGSHRHGAVASQPFPSWYIEIFNFTKIQLCCAANKKSLKFMLWLFDVSFLAFFSPYVRFWTVSFIAFRAT